MIQLTLTQARRFLLAQQFLAPPRSLTSKADILTMFDRLGCIQYDPVNIVGHNPDLVLQARVAGYTPALLDELLYTDRSLWDGFDKVMSIYPARDWPYFARRRAAMGAWYTAAEREPMQLAEMVRAALREKGPLCSLDFDHDGRTEWHWGGTRLVRATLESLFFSGEIGVHHRTGTRRYFDLAERLLPAEVLAAPDPNATLEDYHDWHVLRRIGGLGLANFGAGEHWLAILDAKTPQRQAALQRLISRGAVEQVSIAELPKQAFYIRTADKGLLERVDEPIEPRAAFIAPLDNFLWQRVRLKWLFNFDYIWEVYKPAAQRQYGHYTLPVLYGERFIARFDPQYNRKARRLSIQNWWWEEGVQPDEAMRAAIQQALADFAAYLGADEISNFKFEI